MTTEIRFYGAHREHGWLSNFYYSPFMLDGIDFDTVEHAFQAAKCADERERQTIVNAATPRDAKRLGRQVKLDVHDWAQRRVDVMRGIVVAKFCQNSELAKRLLATGDAILIEAAPRDYFWGEGENRTGRNELGKILMELRAEIKEKLANVDNLEDFEEL